MKIGGANAKHFRDLFDLKVKAGDTYATVVDKFKSKSGLNKILKEKESIIKQIEKQKDIEDEATSGLNLQFLSGKINELEEKQKPLDGELKQLSDEVFMLQEASKEKDNDEQMFKDGGKKEWISNKISKLVKEGKPQNQAVAIANAMYNSRKKKFELGGMQFNQDQIIALGSQFNLTPEESTKLFMEFKKGGYMYQQGGEFLTEGQGLGFVPDDQSRDPETGLFGEVNRDTFADTVTKNPWFDWRNFNPNNPEDVKRFQTQFNELSSTGQQIRVDGKFGEQTASVQLPFTQTRGIVTGDPTISADLLLDPIATPPVTPEEEELARVEGDRLDAILLPDQSPLPPDALQPHLKNQRRFDRVDPNLISPEQQIQEINRNQNQVTKQLNNLPDSQRRAALASLNANTNEQLNKTIQETNRINSQIKTEADRINLNQSNMEENFLATDALDFERRQLTALAKTQNDIRNYFNQLRRIQVGNFNTINNLNLLNDLNDDFQFTSNGIEKTSGNPVFTTDAVERAQAGIPSLSTTPITPTQKKYGGKMKKKRGRRRK